MKRSKDSIDRRRDLIKKALNKTPEAVTLLRMYADQLENSTYTTERVIILSELLCLSDVTIYNDLTS